MVVGTSLPWHMDAIGVNVLFVISLSTTSKIMNPLLHRYWWTGWRKMIAQTGETGFHFVDEAAPPSLMKSLAIEIIQKKISSELVDECAI